MRLSCTKKWIVGFVLFLFVFAYLFYINWKKLCGCEISINSIIKLFGEICVCMCACVSVFLDIHLHAERERDKECKFKAAT